MIVQQFFVKGISHSSYLLGGSTTCAIVDPQRHIQEYLDAADDLGMTITHILETHLHADFISGHLDLAAATGARIYAPRSGDCRFDHEAVGEGDTITIEDMHIRVLDVPGHTPEHLAYVVTDASRGPEPVAVFCGDALFVGDVGRPDLFPDIARELAAKLYTSLHDKLLRLPDFCEVYPAHGAGSLCGRMMGAKRTSTVGYERRYNRALQLTDREAFIRSLTENMPPAPDHFSRCSDINRVGPAVVADLPPLAPLGPAAFDERRRAPGTIVLDVRGYDAFAGHFVPDSIHNDLNGNFATFAGWILPPDRDILLVAHDDLQVRRAVAGLRQVGLDRVAGYLDGGMVAWVKSGRTTEHLDLLSAEELYLRITGGEHVTLIDVRSAGEYGSYHISGSLHIPAPDLRTRHAELNPALPAIVLCSTGNRSSLAASLLKQRGFPRVANVAGGMTGYSAAGHAPECPLCFVPHGPRMADPNTP
ncbi:MAG TPA: MBL fold metallo-hydrolase [Acidobacteriota bacterium]|nr:MBL fold metallo-hydrolase [Acidobacteriota bacterium]